MADNNDPIFNLSPEDRALYFSKSVTNPEVIKVRERVAKEYDRIHGTEEYNLTPASAGMTGSWDGEHKVFMAGDAPTKIRSTIANDMRAMDLDPTDLNSWKQFLIREGYDGAQFWVTRLQEMSTHPDYNTEGTPVNKEARKLVAKLDMIGQDYAMRRNK